MPFASKRQQAFFHSPGAAAAGIKPATTQEFDRSTDFSKLPERAAAHHHRKKKMGWTKATGASSGPTGGFPVNG